MLEDGASAEGEVGGGRGPCVCESGVVRQERRWNQVSQLAC
jgi:hypothetical protein